MTISDVITVMRNGAVVADVDPRNTTIPALISSMIGDRQTRGDTRRTWVNRAQRVGPARSTGSAVAGRLTGHLVRRLAGRGARPRRAGAVRGRRVFDVLFGLAALQAGTVSFRTAGQRPSSPSRSCSARCARGAGRSPHQRTDAGTERRRQPDVGTVCALDRRRSWSDAHACETGQARTAEMSITMRSPLDQVTQLSGGNQQKVAAREVARSRAVAVHARRPDLVVSMSARRRRCTGSFAPSRRGAGSSCSRRRTSASTSCSAPVFWSSIAARRSGSWRAPTSMNIVFWRR